MKEQKTFLSGQSFKDAAPLHLLADQWLSGLPPEERLSEIERAFLASAKLHNDAVALELLKLLERAYRMKGEAEAEQLEAGRNWDASREVRIRAEADFRSSLRHLFWHLPDAKRVDERWSDLEHKYTPVYGVTLSKTKLAMLSYISSGWVCGSSQESEEAFRFICKAFNPKWGPPLGLPEDEMQKIRERRVYDQEEDGILQIVRDRTNHHFEVGHLERLLQQPWIPGPIEKILVIARARNGGVELTRRDIRYAELLQPLEPKKRSLAGLELHGQICERIAQLDKTVVELIKAMQSERGGWWNSDKIGESEYVRGEITVIFRSLKEVLITVQLPEDDSGELGRDVFGRARRHVDKWLGAGLIAVTLLIRGGRAGLELLNKWETCR